MAAKRPCIGAGSWSQQDSRMEDDGGGPIGRGELAELIESIRAEVRGVVDSGLATMESKFMAVIGNKTQKMEAESARRFCEQEQQLVEIKQRITVLEGERPVLRERLEVLQAGLAAA